VSHIWIGIIFYFDQPDSESWVRSAKSAAYNCIYDYFNQLFKLHYRSDRSPAIEVSYRPLKPCHGMVTLEPDCAENFGMQDLKARLSSNA
jgi:hypothetical protein